MADLTDSLDDVATAIHALLETNKVSLGLVDVWYGEHDTIPRTPAVTVEPQRKRRDLQQTGHMTRNDFDVRLMLFYSKLTGPQIQMQEALQLAEAVETILHSDPKLDGLLIYSYVTEVITGYSRRGKVIMKASEISWSGFSKTRITV